MTTPYSAAPIAPNDESAKSVSTPRPKGERGVNLLLPLAGTVIAIAAGAGAGWVMPSGKRERRVLALPAATLLSAAERAGETAKRRSSKFVGELLAIAGDMLAASSTPTRRSSG